MSKLHIDINQRLPLHVLETGLVAYLSGNYSTEYMTEQLRLEFLGENRLKKALRLVNRVILRNPMNNYLLENKESILTALKNKTDRNVILISLLNATFHFSFKVLQTFGKYFKVQDLVNHELVKKAISEDYGSNRSMENGLYSVIPMFLEAEFLVRSRTGVYEIGDVLTVTHSKTIEIVKLSVQMNSTVKFLSADMVWDDPVFEFMKIRG